MEEERFMGAEEIARQSFLESVYYTRVYPCLGCGSDCKGKLGEHYYMTYHVCDPYTKYRVHNGCTQLVRNRLGPAYFIENPDSIC